MRWLSPEPSFPAPRPASLVPLGRRRRWQQPWHRRRRTFRLFHRRRRVWRGLFWLTLLSLTALPSLHWANRWLYQHQRAKAEPLLHALLPEILGERVVVIAPHPDDETLQAGGLIAWLVQRGILPHVFVVTDGDGYDAAIKWFYHEWHITEAHRHAFALRRRQETLAAMSLLNVPADHVHFLGFSERTLPARWLLKGDPTPMRVLKEGLANLKPTAVILPSRYDDHPVHAAVCSLSWAALVQGVAEGALPQMPVVLEALIHYGEFPRPQGFHPDLQLLPPLDLLTVARWWCFPLPRELRERKRQALLQYRTQLPLSGRFLKSFVRTNELFAEPLALWRQPDRIGEPRSLLPFADLTEVTLVPLQPHWQLQMRLRGKPHSPPLVPRPSSREGFRYGVHWFVPAEPHPFLAVTDCVPSATTEDSVLVSAAPEVVSRREQAVIATAFVAHGEKILDIAPLTVGREIRQAELSQRRDFGRGTGDEEVARNRQSAFQPVSPSRPSSRAPRPVKASLHPEKQRAQVLGGR